MVWVVGGGGVGRHGFGWGKEEPWGARARQTQEQLRWAGDAWRWQPRWRPQRPRARAWLSPSRRQQQPFCPSEENGQVGKMEECGRDTHRSRSSRYSLKSSWNPSASLQSAISYIHENKGVLRNNAVREVERTFEHRKIWRGWCKRTGGRGAMTARGPPRAPAAPALGRTPPCAWLP